MTSGAMPLRDSSRRSAALPRGRERSRVWLPMRVRYNQRMNIFAERHPGVWPADPQARAWARCAAAEMHSGFGVLRNECSMTVGLRLELHRVSDGLRSELARLEELWGEGLARFGGPFLAGAAFTAVDAFFVPVAFRVRSYGLPLGTVAAAYAQRLLELPSTRDWEAAALREPWREPGHDAEILAAGRVIEDRRAPAG